MENQVQEAQIPEIWETEEEKRLSVDRLRRFYKEYARKNFRNHAYRNKNTGWKIRVSDQGIGEFKKFRKKEHIILIRILNTMLINSNLLSTVPDNKNTYGVENVSYFGYQCLVNGRPRMVQLTVKKIQNDEERVYYYYKFIDIPLK
jgi:hypothetical protein